MACDAVALIPMLGCCGGTRGWTAATYYASFLAMWDRDTFYNGKLMTASSWKKVEIAVNWTGGINAGANQLWTIEVGTDWTDETLSGLTSNYSGPAGIQKINNGLANATNLVVTPQEISFNFSFNGHTGTGRMTVSRPFSLIDRAMDFFNTATLKTGDFPAETSANGTSSLFAMRTDKTFLQQGTIQLDGGFRSFLRYLTGGPLPQRINSPPVPAIVDNPVSINFPTTANSAFNPAQHMIFVTHARVTQPSSPSSIWKYALNQSNVPTTTLSCIYSPSVQSPLYISPDFVNPAYAPNSTTWLGGSAAEDCYNFPFRSGCPCLNPFA